MKDVLMKVSQAFLAQGGIILDPGSFDPQNGGSRATLKERPIDVRSALEACVAADTSAVKRLYLAYFGLEAKPYGSCDPTFWLEFKNLFLKSAFDQKARIDLENMVGRFDVPMFRNQKEIKQFVLLARNSANPGLTDWEETYTNAACQVHPEGLKCGFRVFYQKYGFSVLMFMAVGAAVAVTMTKSKSAFCLLFNLFSKSVYAKLAKRGWSPSLLVGLTAFQLAKAYCADDPPPPPGAWRAQPTGEKRPIEYTFDGHRWKPGNQRIELRGPFEPVPQWMKLVEDVLTESNKNPKLRPIFDEAMRETLSQLVDMLPPQYVGWGFSSPVNDATKGANIKERLKWLFPNLETPGAAWMMNSDAPLPSVAVGSPRALDSGSMGRLLYHDFRRIGFNPNYLGRNFNPKWVPLPMNGKNLLIMGGMFLGITALTLAGAPVSPLVLAF